MTIIFNISHFSKPRSYPLPTGLTIRHGSPRLMSASSPLWASADVRSFPEVTPPCACDHSLPCPACRPAKPRAWRRKTAPTLPGRKAPGSLPHRRADRKGHQKWTGFTRKRTVCLLNRALLGIFRTNNKEILLFITAYFLFFFLTKKDISR